MKTTLYRILFVILMVSTGSYFLHAQTDTSKVQPKQQHKQSFVDKDGDGYNDNAPDDDGDGIPNGLDPDYKKGKKKRFGQSNYVDLNGDGINDYLQGYRDDLSKDKQTKNEHQHGKSINAGQGNEMGKGKKGKPK
ncbi:MAG: hypothetical protein K9H64_19800 [Bacteroidales bacterium]|nr:hypothetical protein [Bacteroidales bacterium]MCF8458293.1 hypothetical protein [Bacteroidales bacterium]